MNMNPSVSAIIPVYNRKYELKRLLKSFTNIKYNGSLEIIIVDDASTEDIKYHVNQFLKDYSTAIFKYKRLEKNSGPAYAKNFGAKIASGDYLWFLDSDTEIFFQETLTRMISLFKEYPRVKIIGGELIKIHDNLFLNHTSVFPNLFFRCTLVSFKTAKDFNPELIATSNLIIDRKNFKKVGDFNESLELLEDNDFCLCARKLGFKLFTTKNICIIHHVSSYGRDKVINASSEIFEYTKKFQRSRMQILYNNHILFTLFIPFYDIYYGIIIFLREIKQKGFVNIAEKKIGRKLSIFSYAFYHFFALLYSYFYIIYYVFYRKRKIFS